MASVKFAYWSQQQQSEEDFDPLQGAEWIKVTFTAACNVAIPLIKTRPRRVMHWWTDEIVELRWQAVRRWRILTRCRGNQAARDETKEGYHAAKATFRAAIVKAKGRTWAEFLETLEEDPWGRRYKIIFRCNRPYP
ncbi:hypothetical protein KM043_012378 [Ampulex compressa]|nr:hypothetical protein KM043_012378 [Ampulex compressa]